MAVNGGGSGAQENGPGISPLQKLAALQSIIPQFDNLSAVTPEFFIENFEAIATMVQCSDEEKLIILKSRIRGEALSHLINSPDLNQETNYTNFKKKFIAFFDKKVSLATRQQMFSNCKMQPGESVKLYAARVSLITQKFFNSPDLENESVKNLFEVSKLSKFLEGLLPEYKHSTLIKDPQSFKEAVDYVELLEANKVCFPQNSQDVCLSQGNNIVNAVSSDISNKEIKQLLETHVQKTHDTIYTLTKELDKLRLSMRNNFTRNSKHFEPNFRQSHANNSGNAYTSKSFPPCDFCGKRNHLTKFCFYKTNSPRQQSNAQNSPPFWTRENNNGGRSGQRPDRFRDNSNQRPSLNFKRGGRDQ